MIKKLLAVLMIVLAIISAAHLMHRSQDLEVHVYYHKDLIDTIDVSVDSIYTYQGDEGTFHLKVVNGRYCATDVDCPNQVCVHTGWVAIGDEKAIICAPNGITVVQESP